MSSTAAPVASPHGLSPPTPASSHRRHPRQAPARYHPPAGRPLLLRVSPLQAPTTYCATCWKVWGDGAYAPKYISSSSPSLNYWEMHIGLSPEVGSSDAGTGGAGEGWRRSWYRGGGETSAGAGSLSKRNPSFHPVFFQMLKIKWVCRGCESAWAAYIGNILPRIVGLCYGMKSLSLQKSSKSAMNLLSHLWKEKSGSPIPLIL